MKAVAMKYKSPIILAALLFSTSCFASPAIHSIRDNSEKSGSSKSVAIYRLTWDRPDKETIAATVILKENQQESSVTSSKVTNEEKVHSEKTRKLTKNQIENILSLERSSDFWQRPTGTDRVTLDGSVWTLEILRGENYHQTQRWSPLPPYYQSVIDPNTGRVIAAQDSSAAAQHKHSDEVALDLLCLLILFSSPDFDEVLE